MSKNNQRKLRENKQTKTDNKHSTPKKRREENHTTVGRGQILRLNGLGGIMRHCSDAILIADSLPLSHSRPQL